MNSDFDLILNNISAAESISFRETYEEYKRDASFLLSSAGKYHTEKQLLNRYRDPSSMSMEKILKQHSGQFEQYQLIDDEEGNRVVAWLDLWDAYIITRKDKLHDLFFTYKLRQIDILKVDDFLDYHFINSFESNFPIFERFLNLIIRKYKKKFLTAEQINTVKEWISMRKNNAELTKKIVSVVNWTGTKEENKNEFVQLVYALHKAGFINKGKGEITKIVESLSEVFAVELSKNWQSNHSASIHKAKHNYEPPIFKKLKDAYQDYTKSLVEEKKKNK